MRKGGIGLREIVLADLFALLETRPDPVGAAIVGNARGRADTGAGVADQMASARKNVGHLLGFCVHCVFGVFLFEDANLRLVNANLQFDGMLDEIG